jgi:hypothetical protein
MMHRIEDLTLQDLIACINSDFQTQANKDEANAELLHRKHDEELDLASILPL